MAELQRRLRLTEEVIRYLIVRPDDEVPLPAKARRWKRAAKRRGRRR